MKTAYTAKFAGLLYLLLGLLGAFSIAYVPTFIYVPGNASNTLANILEAPFLFRASIASGLLHKIVFVCLIFVLFDLFERYGKIAAGLMVTFAVTSVPIYFIVMLNLYDVVSLLSVVEIKQIVISNIKAYLTGLKFVSVFWGLWLIPFGYLILKSNAVPRIIGLMLIVGGIGYLLNFFGPLLMPNIYKGEILSMLMASISAIGELTVALWLLIKGVRVTEYNRC